MTNSIIDLSQYYTASQAAEVLSQNSGREVNPSYIRKLAVYHKLNPIRIHGQYKLYPVAEINQYIVEERGRKLIRWRREREEGTKSA